MDEKPRIREAQRYYTLRIFIQVFLTPKPSQIFSSISSWPLHSFMHAFVPSFTISANDELDIKENLDFILFPWVYAESCLYLQSMSNLIFPSYVILCNPNDTKTLISSSLTRVYYRKTRLKSFSLEFWFVKVIPLFTYQWENPHRV